MEEEASETRQNAGIRLLRLLDYASNNARHIRASAVIKGGAKLSLRTLANQNQGNPED
jgi:hypothetical protein